MYIYIGQYYHKRGKELNIRDKKLGRTKDIDVREYSLNDTKGPIGYSMVAAWNVGDQVWIERALHGILDDIRSEGEWFEDDKDTLISRVAKFMKEGNFPKINLQSDSDNEELIDEVNTNLTRHERYEEFWSGWVAFCNENSDLRPQAARAQHWCNITIGVRSAHIENIISQQKYRIAAHLASSRYGAHDFFKQLHARKEQIEAAFGEPLIWDHKVDRLSIQIGFELRNADLRDSSKYHEYYEWILSKNLLIGKILVPEAKNFEWPEEPPYVVESGIPIPDELLSQGDSTSLT